MALVYRVVSYFFFPLTMISRETRDCVLRCLTVLYSLQQTETYGLPWSQPERGCHIHHCIDRWTHAAGKMRTRVKYSKGRVSQGLPPIM